MSETTTRIGIDEVRDAAQRIAPYSHRTPVVTCAAIDEIAGRRIFFKCENLQKVGAFKFRGACNAIMRLPDHVAARGVVTHSSGNHAQAVALAAKLRGIPAHIVMPRTASLVKKRAVIGYDATVYDCEPTEASRHGTADEVMTRTGGVMIPPFDHEDVIAGQGTAALELHEEVADLDAIITPVGGGGLLSGTAIASRALRPGITIIGAEPAGADDAARSKAAGVFIPQTGPDTICDGLLTSLGDLTWPIVRDVVDEILVADDDAIVAAMRLMWERAKILCEVNCAVPLAVMLAETFRQRPGLERVGVIVTGGNVDVTNLPF